MNISTVPDQSGISRLYNMLEIYYSGPEPSISNSVFTTIVMLGFFLVIAPVIVEKGAEL